MFSVNHNQMASSVANTLKDHYSNLAVSTQRLSSGLRINGAADDAAGLAIRELMRADIAALNQGARNANDAISMLQTFDGAMSVIDEKLIRMKELAEQAATGTYDSTQRLMIDSEFQAMGAEINRIARATDFNGVKLLDGKFAVRDVEVVEGNYKRSISHNETIADGITGIQAKNWTEAEVKAAIPNPENIIGDTTINITNNNIIKIGDNYLAISFGYNSIQDGETLNISYTPVPPDDQTGGWVINTISATMGFSNQFFWIGDGGQQLSARIVDKDGNATSMTGAATGTWTKQPDPSFTVTGGTLKDLDYTNDTLTFTIDIGGGNEIVQTYSGITSGQNNPTIAGFINATLNISVQDITDLGDDEENLIPDDVIRIHFGPGNDSAEDYYDIKKHDATLKGLGLEGVDIQTQEKAQNALVQINDAIVVKDGIRAEYGAMQNRLENTITNLKTQAENLAISESRISDTDIAQEMTRFVRNQVLTQSAVALLAQANQMPQIVMRLISG